MAEQSRSNQQSPCTDKNLRPVDAIIVSRIRDQLTGETDEALMGRFGISYNTWRKVRSGKPIRRSVAERLEQRMVASVDRP